MAEKIALEASSRTEVRRAIKHLRREGGVPAVLYGHKLKTVSLLTEAKSLSRVWQRAGRTHLVDLSVDGGRARKVLIRQFQTDPRTTRPLHVDFFAVNLREKLSADIPIVVLGESPVVSVEKTGQVVQTLNTLKIECLPSDLPAQLSVDISGLTEIEASLTVKDIQLPDGVTLLHTDPDETVVKIAALRIQPTADEVADAEAAAGAAAAQAAVQAESAGEADGAEGSPA
ncbi:MAG: 50S ribosomal protein L25/general stress protein Ctc [Candidatus Dormibacteria bacterium]